MAIADLLRNFGGKVGDTFASMGSTPLGNLTPEQQRRQNQMQGLRNLGEQFQILGAMQSNRPQQAAFIQNQIKQREIDARNQQLRSSIENDESIDPNLKILMAQNPELYGRYKVALEQEGRAKSAKLAEEERLEKKEQDRLDAIYATMSPEQQEIAKAYGLKSAFDVKYNPTYQTKPINDEQIYKNLAAKIKTEIATNGRESPAFDSAQGGNSNLLEFYDEYIKTGSIDPLKAAIAQLIQGDTVDPSMVNNPSNLQFFSSLGAAQAAGLKSGETFRGTGANGQIVIYQVP